MFESKFDCKFDGMRVFGFLEDLVYETDDDDIFSDDNFLEDEINFFLLCGVRNLEICLSSDI